MQAIKINPELGAVKEKVFFGFELWQVADIFLGMLASLGLVLLLPDMGMFKGLICSIPALPFVLIALKPVYGLKGIHLLRAVIHYGRNNKPLIFKSEEWRKVNEKC
jgi:hypothetical protein